jgi:hypothetical protein
VRLALFDGAEALPVVIKPTLDARAKLERRLDTSSQHHHLLGQVLECGFDRESVGR